MAQQPLVGQGLFIIEASRSHSDTPPSVGLLWTSDQPDAESSTWQHTTLTRDRHPYLRRDSNPKSQQASGRRPTPYTARPLGSAYIVTTAVSNYCTYCHSWTCCTLRASVKSDCLMLVRWLPETCRSKKNYCAVVGNNMKLIWDSGGSFPHIHNICATHFA
jgi:hypothetical protein